MNNEKSEVVRFRENIGIEILFAMRDNEDLPLPNKHRLAKTMQEYFVTLGKAEDVREAGYRWSPNADYWMVKLKDICDALRKDHRQYFFFLRTMDGKTFEGVWKFGDKKEYLAMLNLEHREIGTRVETHNEKLDDGQQRWKLDLPRIDNVPLLN